jgi:threonine/homoserine/homoserine lactone efflux protein
VVTTSIGLVGMLLASEPLFDAIKLAGATYLIWLGAQPLCGAFRPDRTNTDRLDGGTTAPSSVMGAFRQSLLSDLGKPKITVFFASVLPQFALNRQRMLTSLVLLSLLFVTMTFTWLSLYAVVVASAGDAFPEAHSGSNDGRRADRFGTASGP